MNEPLTEQDWRDAAQRLGVEPAVLKAVAEVESPRGAFMPSGVPTMLFERHKFSQFTKGKFDATHPHLSSKKPGGYGTYDEQPGRLEAAAQLDRAAALKATSFGRFQIMGFNHDLAGFPVLQDFVNAMWGSEKSQLNAFVTTLMAFGLVSALRGHDWDKVALKYNGKNYRINHYAEKLGAAYRKHAGAVA